MEPKEYRNSKKDADQEKKTIKEGNAFYEIDMNCIHRKEKEKEQRRKRNQIFIKRQRK